jgi:hypothetical protein
MKPIDEGMAPIRAVKHAISREVGHDPHRYMAYVQEAAKPYALQLVAARRLAKRRKNGGEPAAHK